MKLMIIYGTTEGHTRKICEFLKNKAEKSGHHTELFDATQHPPSPDNYDAIIIAGSVHAGTYQNSVRHYAEEWHKELNNMKSLFLSVSLAAATDEHETRDELSKQTEKFLLQTGWNPKHIEYAAGALLYTKYDFFKRLLMRLISKRSGGDTDTSKDHEYTDWKRVEELIHHLDSI